MSAPRVAVAAEAVGAQGVDRDEQDVRARAAGRGRRAARAAGPPATARATRPRGQEARSGRRVAHRRRSSTQDSVRRTAGPLKAAAKEKRVDSSQKKGLESSIGCRLLAISGGARARASRRASVGSRGGLGPGDRRDAEEDEHAKDTAFDRRARGAVGPAPARRCCCSWPRWASPLPPAAQSVLGTIRGTVVDPQGARRAQGGRPHHRRGHGRAAHASRPTPRAATRPRTSGPGTYRVEVVTTNFKKYEQTGVVVLAGVRHAARGRQARARGA